MALLTKAAYLAQLPLIIDDNTNENITPADMRQAWADMADSIGWLSTASTVTAQWVFQASSSVPVKTDRTTDSGSLIELRQSGTSLCTIRSDSATASVSNVLIRASSGGAGVLKLQTNGSNDALILDASQNATFAGDLTVTDGLLSITTSSSPSGYFERTGNSGAILEQYQAGVKLLGIFSDNSSGSSSNAIIRASSGGTGVLKLQTNGSNDALILDASQNATFAGDLTVTDGQAVFDRNGGNPLVSNRKTSAGIILSLQQEGTHLLDIFSSSSTPSLSDLIFRAVGGESVFRFQNSDSADVLVLDYSKNATFSGHVAYQTGRSAKSTAYTLVDSDNGKWIQVTGTTTIKVPASGISDGWTVMIVNEGTGTVTIDDNGKTINSKGATHPLLETQWGGCTIMYDGTDFTAIGDLT